jgi:hypothetical protein
MKRHGNITLCVLLSLIVLVWFGAANPLNIFVRRSDHFSMMEFQSIEPGTHIDDAITRLGPPIKVVRSRYDLGCPGCVAYYFLGDPPPWLISFEEAWLLVDTRGRVVTATVNSEP